MKLGILVPVWRDYEWMAPILLEGIRVQWPSHPEIRFCGLADTSALPAFPLESTTDRSNWTQVLLGGVKKMKAEGFGRVYLILEEHLPLAPCHEEHLNTTLPALMESLPASYISLMGWDNRRYTSRSPVVGHHQLKHLTGVHDPRFHLHPALWDLETLEICCRIALRNPEKNGSAWHFEKACARPDADLPQGTREGCYQIRASQMALRPRTPLREVWAALDRLVFHKLMALYPLIPARRVGRLFLRHVPFDDVFCNGPYPMFYSGIMAKGGLNKYFMNHLRRNNPILRDRILDAMPESSAAKRGM
ncbi:MAG: hypothetical protein IAE94_13770 [Chthoniobacterales bacterium]|nr:hypothetical protein [Chthoniobacterales bacterium]